MDIPRLRVESALAEANTTAIATRILNRICNLHHSLWQCRILNPLSEAWDRTHVLMDTSRIHYC